MCTPMFITTLSTNGMICKHHKCPTTDKWIKKYIYICNGVLCNSKKNKEVQPAATWL